MDPLYRMDRTTLHSVLFRSTLHGWHEGHKSTQFVPRKFDRSQVIYCESNLNNATDFTAHTEANSTRMLPFPVSLNFILSKSPINNNNMLFVILPALCRHHIEMDKGC